MPITCMFAFLAMLGVFLLVPAVPVCVILLVSRKKKPALVVLGVPVGLIALSVLWTLLIFAGAELQSRILSARPRVLFKVTFGFKPSAETRVLEAYHHGVMDYATTVMKFRTTRETVDRITARHFIRCDRTTFVQAYGGNSDNLPQRVRSWFLPPEEQADLFFIANAFRASYAHSEAVLCYDEKTQIAYFHWVGLD